MSGIAGDWETLMLTDAARLWLYSLDTLTNSRLDRALQRDRGPVLYFWWRAVQRQWRVWRADTFGNRQMRATVTSQYRTDFALAGKSCLRSPGRRD